MSDNENTGAAAPWKSLPCAHRRRAHIDPPMRTHWQRRCGPHTHKYYIYVQGAGGGTPDFFSWDVALLRTDVMYRWWTSTLGRGGGHMSARFRTHAPILRCVRGEWKVPLVT